VRHDADKAAMAFNEGMEMTDDRLRDMLECWLSA
jgi:hypothetical protein